MTVELFIKPAMKPTLQGELAHEFRDTFHRHCTQELHIRIRIRSHRQHDHKIKIKIKIESSRGAAKLHPRLE